MTAGARGWVAGDCRVGRLDLHTFRTSEPPGCARRRVRASRCPVLYGTGTSFPQVQDVWNNQVALAVVGGSEEVNV